MILQYELNKSYIASTLCENKNRPQLHCNGNCVLMSKMKADEQQDTPPGSQPVKIKIIETIFVCDEQVLAVAVSKPLQKVFSDHYLAKNYSSPRASIFHPPLLS